MSAVLLAVAVAVTPAVAVVLAPAGAPVKPLLFLGVGLLAFVPGYVATARRLPEPGLLYGFVSRGLGRPPGLAAAGLALLSYTALQLGLYGLIGENAAPLLVTWFGIRVEGWAAALCCWAVVAGCGLLPAAVPVGVVAVLVPAEIVVLAGSGPAELGQVAGLGAALIALHLVIVRLLVALGRERILPSALGRPLRHTSASLTQSFAAGAVLGGCGWAGIGIGRAAGVAGGLGILLLLIVTSLAVLLFLNRNPAGEGVWSRLLAPAASTVALGVLVYWAALSLPALLGVPAERVWVTPGAAATAVLLGAGYGLMLRGAAPVTYAGIGLGDAAVVVTPTRPALPRQRMPGAHRPERVNREELTG